VRFSRYLNEGRAIVDELKAIAGSSASAPKLPPASIMGMRKSAADANASSLCEMLMYGLKGLCAYADHANVHGKEDPRVYAFVHEALAFLASPDRNDLGKALKMVRELRRLLQCFIF
jgi:hypothetical protein